MPAPNLGSVASAVNYLVPSSGRTHAVPVEGVFSAAPYTIDWNQFKNDNFAFQPQGVFIDNSQGTGELDVVIYANGLNGPVFWTIKCPAGAYKSANFPAPNGQSVAITGNGQATVIFVDFPVLPDAGAVTIENTVTVTWPSALPVAPTVNASGTPYQFTEVPVLMAAPLYNAAITGATLTTGNMTPAASNLYLRKLQLSLTGNAAMAVAGLNTITATLNGTQIYKRQVFLPAASASLVGQAWEETLDFAKEGMYFGAGSLVVTVSTALSTGALEVNAFPG